jgi:hypothetical protein
MFALRRVFQRSLMFAVKDRSLFEMGSTSTQVSFGLLDYSEKEKH